MGTNLEDKIDIQINGSYVKGYFIDADEIRAEEYDNYIPPEVKHVVILDSIRVNRDGEGKGTELMHQFLAMIDKGTEDQPIVLLDIAPLDIDTEADDDFFLSRAKFYSKFGFEMKDGYRMIRNLTEHQVPAPDLYNDNALPKPFLTPEQIQNYSRPKKQKRHERSSPTP